MYVKCFDTVMVLNECQIFTFLNFPLVLSHVRPDTRRERNPEDRCRQQLEDMAGDTAGGT
ncbi:unnamed protein product, partial [Staurois parvus]